MLINDYLSIPKKTEYLYDYNNIIYVETFDFYPSQDFDLFDFYPSQDFDFSINIGDGKLSTLENVIIWVLFLWSFMRLIDLMQICEKYKHINKWSCFWKICEYS